MGLRALAVSVACDEDLVGVRQTTNVPSLPAEDARGLGREHRPGQDRLMIVRAGVENAAVSPLADDALELLMREHGDAVLRLAWSYLRDRPAAEDVFQEVFVRAYRHGAGIRQPERARAWLLTTTANVCRDQLRSWSHRNVLTSESVPDPGAAPMSADERIDRSDRALVEALLALPPRLREVVYLRYYEGLSIEEIASVTGAVSVTVRTRLHRARRALARALGQEVEAHA
jgi:RNA polymerase sigma-70 factor (ECF subfamily)